MEDDSTPGSVARRSSSRSIKRRRFDDELVESSLVKGDRGKPSKPEPQQQLVTKQDSPPVPASLPTFMEKKKGGKAKRSKAAHRSTIRPSQGWKAEDDLRLILAVEQTCDLAAVHVAVRFSSPFTLREIKQRWHSLLYDAEVSADALAAVRLLHADVVADIRAAALFSQAEERLLSSIASTSQPTLDIFARLLSTARSSTSDPHAPSQDCFLPCRSAKALQAHWLLMKQYHLLPDQSVQPLPRKDHVLNFCDAEDLLDDAALLQAVRLGEKSEELGGTGVVDQLKSPVEQLRPVVDQLRSAGGESAAAGLCEKQLETELRSCDRKLKRRMRRLEGELPQWQVLVENVMGVSPVEFDSLTLAVIRGRLVRYLMRSRQISLGRASVGAPVDVNLTLEGPAWKISRRQGWIRLEEDGRFYLENEGRRAVYVNGSAVLRGEKKELCNSCVIEVCCLRFIFLINTELVTGIRQQMKL